jgi:RNA polymerase sigma factor (sigma-70 family)
MTCHAGPAADDAGLLNRFLTDRDPAAFEALVDRHGPMVLRVCQHMLGNRHDAEDAFQATFLVLARKAANVRPPGALAGWLHGVAYRVARKARRAALRRRHEGLASDLAPPDPRPDPLMELTAREALRALEEEVQRLPEAYRLPVVLCCLHGATQEEAARQLGCTPGSVKGRLERGRARLHARLARRGLTLSAALAAAELSRGPAAAALTAATARQALAFAAGSGASGPAALLAEGVLLAAGLSRLKAAAALLLLVAGLFAAAGVLAQSKPGTAAPPAAPPEPPAVAIAPEPRRVDGDGEPLPRGAVLRLGSLRLRHGYCLQSLAFTPDGELLFSGGWDQVIRAWDPATGQQVREVRAPEHGVGAIAVSPDGQLLAGAGMTGDVLLWDAATGREVRRLGGHRRVLGVAFSPKGDRLVSGHEAAASVWDVSTGKALHTLAVEVDAVAVAFSPDGRHVATGSKGTVIWDADTGKLVHQLTGEGNHVNALAFSPDGRALLSAVLNGPLVAWDVATGKPLAGLPGNPHHVHALAFSPDGKLLATGGGDLAHAGEVHLWDWPARKERWNVTAHPSVLHTLAFSPDGRTLASGSAESLVRIWDTATGKSLNPTTAGHQERVTSVAYSSDGGAIITGSWDRTIRVWDTASGKERVTLAVGTEAEARAPFRAAAVRYFTQAPDGKLLAVVRSDGSVRIFELPSGKEVRSLPGHTVAFSPDGRLIAAGGSDAGSIGLYERDTGRLVRELRGHQTAVAALAFTDGGKTLVSRGMVSVGAFRPGDPAQSETEFVRAWDVATGKQLQASPGGGALIDSLTSSSDGRTVATLGGEGKTVVLLEAATGGRRAELSGHTMMLFRAKLAPDGRTAVSAGVDGAIRLWELPSGKEIARLEGHRGAVMDLDFSPDGRRLASAGHDTTVLVWDVARYTRRERAPVRLSADELRSAWEDLGGDAGKAYRAIGALAAAPEQSVPFLAERVRPAAAPDAKRVAKLLADLDDERFEVREQASRELEGLGRLAGPALRQALAGRPSAEADRRLTGLVKKVAGAAPTPEEVRAIRVVEALEQAGTAAARRLLTDLAGGVPEARLTREAKATLQRLPNKYGEER